MASYIRARRIRRILETKSRDISVGSELRHGEGGWFIVLFLAEKAWHKFIPSTVGEVKISTEIVA